MSHSLVDHTKVDVSVLIPVFNEEEGVRRCVAEVSATLDKSGYSYEMVFIDDGSTDQTLAILSELQKTTKNLLLLKCHSNLGQQRAMFEALKRCSGRAIITYDSDLQFHPDCLPEMTKLILSGYDIVSGIRTQRLDPLLYNRIPSLIGRYLINNALGIKVKDFGAVKAYSHKLVQEILKWNMYKVIIPACAYYLSNNHVEIPVRHQTRSAGVSKWSVVRRAELYFDVYTAFAERPFQSIMVGGALAVFASIALGIGILLYKFFVSPWFAGTIIFFDLFLFFSGITFMVLSFIGEFVVRIYRQNTHLRPNVVSELREPGVNARSMMGRREDSRSQEMHGPVN